MILAIRAFRATTRAFSAEIAVVIPAISAFCATVAVTEGVTAVAGTFDPIPVVVEKVIGPDANGAKTFHVALPPTIAGLVAVSESPVTDEEEITPPVANRSVGAAISAIPNPPASSAVNVRVILSPGVYVALFVVSVTVLALTSATVNEVTTVKPVAV